MRATIATGGPWGLRPGAISKNILPMHTHRAFVLLGISSLVLCVAHGCAARKSDAGASTQGTALVPHTAPPAALAAAAPTGEQGPSPDLRLISGKGRVTFAAPRGDVVIEAEVVSSPQGRQQGLMYRRTMAPDRGMVFIFPDEEVQSFWMRNTYVALDIIFVNEKMEVVGVAADATPLTTSPRTVGRRSKFVVEVVAGLCATLGIRAGTKVRFEGIPTSTDE